MMKWSEQVKSVEVVKNVEVEDKNLTIEIHINKKSITLLKNQSNTEIFTHLELLVNAVVSISRLDYCNSVIINNLLLPLHREEALRKILRDYSTQD